MQIYEHPILGQLSTEDKVTFMFEGKQLQARRGQTVASALMAHGVLKLGCSRKLLQPRGVFCSNGRCCSCFMTVNDREHVRSCVTLVTEGMKIKMNTSDPAVRRDPHAD